MLPMDKLNAIAAYWDKRAQGYSLSNREEWADPESFYRQLLKQIALPKLAPKARALDLGCGPGLFSLTLAEIGFETTGIDASPNMVAEARKNAQALGAANQPSFLLGDATAPAVEPGFDLIVSRNVVWNLENPALAYCRWAQLLKPQGMLVIFDGNHYHYLHDKRYRFSDEGSSHRHIGNVDTSVMENIARDLPMSAHLRPQWDLELLQQTNLKLIEQRILHSESCDGETLVKDFMLVLQRG